MSESLPGKDGNSRYLAAALSWIRLRLEHMANRDQVAAKSSGPAVKAIEQAAKFEPAELAPGCGWRRGAGSGGGGGGGKRKGGVEHRTTVK